MRQFRGCSFPGGEFRPLYIEQTVSESREFSAGLPVTRINQTAQAELQVGDRSFTAVACSAESSFSPEQTIEVLPQVSPFEILALPCADKD